MKLATFEYHRQIQTGAVIAEGLLLDLPAAASAIERPLLHSMQTIIENEPRSLDLIATLLAANRGDHVVPAKAVRLLAPLPVPNSIRDFANFELHCRQALENSMAHTGRLAARPGCRLSQLPGERCL